MVWRLFATKLETIEDVVLSMRAPYFYPTSTLSRSPKCLIYGRG
jgi:hypothetical protein